MWQPVILSTCALEDLQVSMLCNRTQGQSLGDWCATFRSRLSPLQPVVTGIGSYTWSTYNERNSYVLIINLSLLPLIQLLYCNAKISEYTYQVLTHPLARL